MKWAPYESGKRQSKNIVDLKREEFYNALNDAIYYRNYLWIPAKEE